MPWTAFIDGGSRGNPGPAAAGVHLLDERGRETFAAGVFIGKATCNVAEYTGLLTALEALEAAGVREVAINSDSELLVRQIQGRYKVKAPGLIPLYDQARTALRRLASWSIRHIPREQNARADKLANQAMDAAETVLVVDAHGVGKQIPALARAASALPGSSMAPPPTPAPTGRAPAQAGSASPPSGRASAPPAATRIAAPTAQPTGRPLPPRGTPASSRGTINVVVVKAPGSVCAARLRQGQVFEMNAVTPAGLCLEACPAIVEMILAARAAAKSGRQPGRVTVSCPHPGCSAVFEIRAD